MATALSGKNKNSNKRTKGSQHIQLPYEGDALFMQQIDVNTHPMFFFMVDVEPEAKQIQSSLENSCGT